MVTRRCARGNVARAARLLCALLVPCAGGCGVDDAHGRRPGAVDREGGAAPSIQALALTGDGVLYAGSFGFGVFVSRNRGETWESMNAGLGDRFILCLSVDDRGTVYAGTVRGGVFRTRRDGATWESVKDGLRSVEVKSLLSSHGILYAGTGNGVYQFDEASRRWSEVAPGLEQTLVTSLAVTDDRRVFAGTAGHGMYRLDIDAAGAAGWERAGHPLVDPVEHLTHAYIRVTVAGPARQLYVGTLDGGVYRSRDAGRTWRPVGRSLPNDSIRGIVVAPTALYVATGRGVFTGNLRDGAWTPVNDGLTELSVQTLIGSPRDGLYVGTGAGAFRSRDAGKHWVDISETLGRHHARPRPYL